MMSRIVVKSTVNLRLRLSYEEFSQDYNHPTWTHTGENAYIKTMKVKLSIINIYVSHSYDSHTCCPEIQSNVPVLLCVAC